MIRLLLVFVCLLAGCSRAPEWYSPPAQRKPLEDSDYGHLGHYIPMNDPNADAYLVRDISHGLEGGTWRWAYAHPQMRFFLKNTRGLKFSMDYTIAEATFRATGPVTISFIINGHPFDRVRCDRPGDKHYEKRVPEKLLFPGQENIVDLEPDKVWTAGDGVQLSFILTRAGFID